jgi:hypothetical protein
MYSANLNDLSRFRRDEMVAQARHAKQCRQLARPNVVLRVAAKWRRPSIATDQRRPTQPAVAGRQG